MDAAASAPNVAGLGSSPPPRRAARPSSGLAICGVARLGPQTSALTRLGEGEKVGTCAGVLVKPFGGWLLVEKCAGIFFGG